MNTSVVDCSDKILQVGDLVLRATYSSITFHRITKINRKSIKLTCGRKEIFMVQIIIPILQLIPLKRQRMQIQQIVLMVQIFLYIVGYQIDTIHFLKLMSNACKTKKRKYIYIDGEFKKRTSLTEIKNKLNGKNL